MAGQMEYTYFPVTLSDLPAELNYRELLEETFDDRHRPGSRRTI